MTTGKESTASLARGLSAPRLSRILAIDHFLISRSDSGATFNEICAALGVAPTDASRRRLLRQDMVSMELLAEDPDNEFEIEVRPARTENNPGKEKMYVSRVPLSPRYFTEGEKVRLSNPIPEIFNCLAESIATKNKVILSYTPVGEENNLRRKIRFSPLLLHQYAGHWRIIGACEDGFIAPFYLQQVVKVEPTLDKYNPALIKRVKGLYSDVVGTVPRHLRVARPENGVETPEIEDITLWAAATTARYLRAFPLTEDQDELYPEAVAEMASQYRIPDEDGCVFVFSAYITPELIRKIIALDSAVVLSPPRLRAIITERLDKTLHYYNK